MISWFCFVDSSYVMCCGVTYRRLNFPPTVAGITVFAPAPEKAPSIPWIDRDGLRIRAMSTVGLSSETAILAPAAASRSAIE